MLQETTYKIWIITTLMLTFCIFIILGSITVYIDPLFHYHAPLSQFEYPLGSSDERYLNDGIIRNFNYNSIITGTSMTENFKTSEADRIFHADFIKVPFSGATYKEVNENLERAYQTKKEIGYVIRCLDYTLLIKDKDNMNYLDYPIYLYNDNPFDDLNYLLNKAILINQTLEVIRYTNSGNKTTSFDIYANWNGSHTFGAETVLNTYTLKEPSNVFSILTEDEQIFIIENIKQNVTALIKKHPETEFYLFFPPYSICYWDELKNDGEIDRQINAEQIAIEEILKCSNVKLYSFTNNFELVCNLDNYKDRIHYGEWVNSWILQWMHNEEYLLTNDNYLDYIETIRDFYNNYDYTSLRE